MIRDRVDGGWLYGEPNDGDCVEDGDEDRMLFVFNRGGQADSNGFADAAGTETHRALIMKAVDPGENAGSTFVRVWAREFRYDGPRQRYLARVLDPGTLYPLADQWTDYVGDAAVLDYRFEYFGSGDEVRLTGYLPGVSQTDLVTDDTQYFHADHLGSTWYTSGKPAGDFEVTAAATRTAFGETVNADWGIPESRYGYAGAHGYQEHDFASPADPGAPDGYTDARFKASPTAGFPYMHLGARYYDPGSGRFLQRDPIGLRGGFNVYEYASSSPMVMVDPSGLIAPPSSVGGPTGKQAVTGAGVVVVMVGGAILTGGASTTAGVVGGGLTVVGSGMWGFDEGVDFFTCAIYYPLAAWDTVFNMPQPRPRPLPPPPPPLRWCHSCHSYVEGHCLHPGRPGSKPAPLRPSSGNH